MRHPTLIAAALALSLAAACTPTPAPTDGPPVSAGAAEAQRTWQTQRPAAYTYQYEVSCFCLHRGSYAVEVRNGRIASVRDAATGAPAEASRLEYIVTPDRLFEMIAEASRDGTYTRVEYDRQMGYPVEAEIGTLANDAGTLYRITDLRAL